jgi:hypothetical protein
MRHERLIAPVFFALLCSSLLSGQQRSTVQSGKPQSFVKRCAEDEDVVVRFYFNPLAHGEGTAHSPLIFMPVSSQDPRLDTRPAWILYITLTDLQSALNVLADRQILWKESTIPKRLVVDPVDLPEPQHDSMEIAVSSPRGSASAQVGAERTCDLLSEISDAVTNAKARESLSFYRRSVFCAPSEANGDHH